MTAARGSWRRYVPLAKGRHHLLLELIEIYRLCEYRGGAVVDGNDNMAL